MNCRLPACLLIVSLALGGNALAKKKQPHVEGGRLTFELTDLEGRPVGSEDERFRGKVVLVDLWATWCPPCLTSIPTFVDLQERYGSQGLVVLGIAFERLEDGEERRQHLRGFVQKHGIDYLILDGGPISKFDEALPGMREVSGFPIEVVIDREGRVVDSRNGYGYSKRWARKLEAQLAALLAGGDDGAR